MKRKLCLAVAILASFSFVSCRQIQARSYIKDANSAYLENDYARALELYKRAATKENFDELDRMIGYSYMGLYRAGDDSAENVRNANLAAAYLDRYLQDTDDLAAEEVLINLYLNSNQQDKAIERLERRLDANPKDTTIMKSIANLLAGQGNAAEALEWYRRVVQIEPTAANNYTVGVVAWEMVSKGLTGSVEESEELIAVGKQHLERAIEADPEYFDALVYINLLYREEAKFSDDFIEKEELMAKAEEYRQRAIAIAQKRAAEAERNAAELGLDEDEGQEDDSQPAATGAE